MIKPIRAAEQKARARRPAVRGHRLIALLVPSASWPLFGQALPRREPAWSTGRA